MLPTHLFVVNPLSAFNKQNWPLSHVWVPHLQTLSGWEQSPTHTDRSTSIQLRNIERSDKKKGALVGRKKKGALVGIKKKLQKKK